MQKPLTGYENLNFDEVTELINQHIDIKIEFDNVNPFRFYAIKKKEGISKGMIIVMILLHFLPRFQKQPVIYSLYERLTGKKPTSLKEFIEREVSKFA